MFQDNLRFQMELIKLLTELCGIPAPSGQEEKRADFIQNWLHGECAIPFADIPSSGSDCNLKCQGSNPANISVMTDKAKNVLVLVNPTRPGSMPLFMAHTDTVFPDTEPMPCVCTDLQNLPLDSSCDCLDNLLFQPLEVSPQYSAIEKIYSPGVGDDTACVAILMLYLKYYKEQLLALNKPILFAFNSCEEGLGNLKGCRQIMEDYGRRITHVTSFDGGVNGICNHAVGSLRYEITINTRGGHSYNDFGNRNAIQAMCELIQQLYQIQIPDTGRNTYNIGTITGGTSVNTIAQSCSCLFEYRSDTKSNLEWMNQYFLQTIKSIKEKNPDIRLDFNLVGERPCMGDVDTTTQQWLTGLALTSIRRFSCISDTTFNPGISIGAGSTDCNIPLSMGIPAICFGGLLGDGVHTREEYVTVALLMQEAYIMEDYLCHILC